MHSIRGYKSKRLSFCQDKYYYTCDLFSSFASHFFGKQGKLENVGQWRSEGPAGPATAGTQNAEGARQEEEKKEQLIN